MTHHSPRLRIIAESVLDAALDEEIRRGLCLCFPADADVFGKTRYWHGVGPSFTVIAEAAGQVVGHVGLVDRVIRVGQTELRVAGVQNVFVLPEYRGTGPSTQILTAATGEGRRRGFDFGLLFCLPGLDRVYARCGWQHVSPRRITRIDETGTTLPLPAKNIAMYYPIRATPFPPGDIDLQGNDW